MKLRSKKEYDPPNILLKNDVKSKLSAIHERRQQVKKRACGQLNEVTKKKGNQLRVVLKRVEAGDIVVNRVTIDEIRKSYEEKYKNIVKMTDHIKPVDALELTGNLSENWRRFKRNYDIFEVAAGISGKAETIKVSTFLNAIGPDAVEVFDTLGLTDAQKQLYAEVTKAFATFCGARKNTVYERYMFYKRDQKEGESFDSFLMDVKRLVRSCEFGDATNEMMRDRMVMGIADKKLQTKLLETAALTYDLAVEKCRASEATKQQQENMSKTTEIHALKSDHVAVVNSSKNYKRGNNNNKGKSERAHTERNTDRNAQHRSNDTHNRNANRNVKQNENSRKNTSNSSGNNDNQWKCKRCNYSHGFRDNCPAYGKTCNTCSKPNHFSSVCRQRNINSIEFSENNQEFYIGAIERNVTSETNDVVCTRWIESVRINKQNVEFKVDTGAEMNVLPLRVFKRLNLDHELSRTDIRLRAFGGQRIVPVGMCSLLCNYKNMFLRVVFAVVDLDVIPILGLPSCTRFRIVNPPRSKQNVNKINRHNL